MRWDRVRERLYAAGGVLALTPGDDFRYLAGWAPVADERLTFLLVSASRQALVVPSVNADEAAAHLPREVSIFRYTDEDGPRLALESAWTPMADADLTPYLSDDARWDHVRIFQEVTGLSRMELSSVILGPLRRQKQADEIERLAACQAINDKAMEKAFQAMTVGMTEAELADVIRRAFIQNGADREAFIIVAAGDHSAHPHHMPGRRVLAPGPVLLDIGCYKDGYASDMTRVAYLGAPDPDFVHVHAVVNRALQAGYAAAQAGAPVEVVDRAARSVIEAAGYGEYFVHRTGHGIGLSVHEAPSVMEGNTLPLEEGMVFSIEPGIYLPGRFGVRLEEVAVMGPRSAQILSRVSRAIWVKDIA